VLAVDVDDQLVELEVGHDAAEQERPPLDAGAELLDLQHRRIGVGVLAQQDLLEIP
jgi:hypothetical protein